MKKVIFGLDINDYHHSKPYSDYDSSTSLKEAARSLLHYKEFKKQKRKSFFDFGNAFELALISPADFNKKVVVFDESGRPEPEKTFGSKLNKAWKDGFFESNSDKYVINKTGYESEESIYSMINNCKLIPSIRKSLMNTSLQPSFFAEINGLKLKARPDIAKPKIGNIIDVKTIDDAAPFKVSKQIIDFKYALQACLQIKLVETTGYMEVKNYFWLFVEKKSPFMGYLYRFDEEDQEVKMMELDSLLERVRVAKETGIYEGYNKSVAPEPGYEKLAGLNILKAKIW